MTIEDYGWSDALQNDFAPYAALGLIPARVTAHHRALWRLATTEGELAGRLSGKFALEAGPGEHPAVGDWLAVSRVDASNDATIHALLPRRSMFSRRAVSEPGMQVVAANVDVAFLVAAMNGDLNVRRLERYLVATRDSGAAPVDRADQGGSQRRPRRGGGGGCGNRGGRSGCRCVCQKRRGP